MKLAQNNLSFCSSSSSLRPGKDFSLADFSPAAQKCVTADTRSNWISRLAAVLVGMESPPASISAFSTDLKRIQNPHVYSEISEQIESLQPVGQAAEFKFESKFESLPVMMTLSSGNHSLWLFQIDFWTLFQIFFSYENVVFYGVRQNLLHTQSWY